MTEPMTAPLVYACACGEQYDVLAEEKEDGEWVILEGETERCPGCGKFGTCELDREETERPALDLGSGVTLWLI